MRIPILLLFVAILLRIAPSTAVAADPNREYVIVCGGVSLWKWEKFKKAPHDNWWANFIRASRIRIEQIQQTDPGANITLLAFRPSYVTRSRQDSVDLLSNITSVRDAFGIRLVWFSSANEMVNYLNQGQPRDRVKICDFEYFGHSNKACWMFDYSNEVDSASKAWFHEKDLGKINRGIFTRDAFVKSWGCHSGELFSKRFWATAGVRMWGAVGKTQYMTHELPILSSAGGHWTR